MMSHISGGNAKMVDIGEKKDMERRAVASGEIMLKRSTIEAIRNNNIIKGSVLETARIASIMAVKNTASVIPMCHQILITGIDIQFELGTDTVNAKVQVKSVGKTGVEMEALHGVSTALLTIWDMVKSEEKDDTGNYPFTGIRNVYVVEKVKGQIQ